jgi:5'-3' exonuclease
MGIPSYFSHIIKNYRSILKSLTSIAGQDLGHLYMDCNSIIYDAFYGMEKTEGFLNLTDVEIEDNLINIVCDEIERYILLLNPIKTVFIAFDGVAPFAKMKQQRTRRYKSEFMSKLNGTQGEIKKWSTSAITPGTTFMEKLSKRIYFKFNHSEVKYKTRKVIVSTSEECGEGEHKIFKYIRTQVEIENDSAAVYGLDSDLIMLSIFHCKLFRNMYVFREAPEFIKSSLPEELFNKTNEPYFLDIPLLKNSILTTMDCKYSDPQRIYDYVFFCFFLGNDFLPHFPSLNIRTNGIQVLIDAYKTHIGNYSDRFLIGRDGDIMWKTVSIFVSKLAKYEHERILGEYDLKKRWLTKKWSMVTPDDKQFLITSVPVIYRAEENYICPEEKFWENRYYKSLFNEDKSEIITKICNNYLEGLEWVFKYYTTECPDWSWKYDYNYPPLLVDLANHVQKRSFSYFKNAGLRSKIALSPTAQLCYVLPLSMHSLLPKNVQTEINKKYSNLYPNNGRFCWAFCRYLWEAHIELPDISLETLKKISIVSKN